jgi:hypothetical protein
MPLKQKPPEPLRARAAAQNKPQRESAPTYVSRGFWQHPLFCGKNAPADIAAKTIDGKTNKMPRGGRNIIAVRVSEPQLRPLPFAWSPFII